jgi:hypothetical protein
MPSKQQVPFSWSPKAEACAPLGSNVIQVDMDAESFVKAVCPQLKAHGFRKSNATWRKEQGESVAVFNVQKSSWGGGTYYVNVGAYFHALGDDASPTENKCHVQLRLEVEDPSAVVAKAIEWFQARTLLREAALLAEADAKKGLVFHVLRTTAAAARHGLRPSGLQR